MLTTRSVTFPEFESTAAELGITLPIEQTEAWSRYEATIPGRAPWGQFVLERDGAAVALVAFADYETHGYHYLRAHHAPVWAATPSEDDEREAVSAIRELVRARERRQVFARMGVLHDLDACQPVLSTYPYDQTVVIDIAGGDEEEILSRMKGRGRRDVRKSLRECPATFADETERATADFSEYYEVMRDTASRDGFTPAPKSDYEDMLRILGPEHCRLFCGRIDGRVITWTISTISGTQAVRYYGASRSESARSLATDGLIFFECHTLGKMGCTTYDQMGIGNDFSPHLKSLNTFKTKFSKEVTDVAPDRDVPFHDLFYKALVKAKALRDRKRD